MLILDFMLFRLKFQQDLIHFSRCFDLHGSGMKYREDETRKHIAVLREELLLLETGTSMI